MNKRWLSWFRREKKQAARLVDDPAAVVGVGAGAAEKAQRTPGPLQRVWEDTQTAIRLVRAWARHEYPGVARSTIVSILGALLYFVSPIDAIFDAIPVLGLVDDAAV